MKLSHLLLQFCMTFIMLFYPISSIMVGQQQGLLGISLSSVIQKYPIEKYQTKITRFKGFDLTNRVIFSVFLNKAEAEYIFIADTICEGIIITPYTQKDLKWFIRQYDKRYKVDTININRLAAIVIPEKMWQVHSGKQTYIITLTKLKGGFNIILWFEDTSLKKL